MSTDINILPAHECPHSADCPELKHTMDTEKNNENSCIAIIESPSAETEAMVQRLVANYGAHSINYLRGKTSRPDRCTGQFTQSIDSYLRPYLFNTQTQKATTQDSPDNVIIAFFMNDNIKAIIKQALDNEGCVDAVIDHTEIASARP